MSFPVFSFPLKQGLEAAASLSIKKSLKIRKIHP